MPHCLLKEVNLPDFPFQKEEYCFVAEFHKQDEQQTLILVRFLGDEFFLRKRYRVKHKDWIIKCDKILRNVPTGIIKKAIQILADFNRQNLISHNLSNNSLKQTLISSFYKVVEDFIDFSSPFELEIGFGSGRHLLYQAQKNPAMQFIGIELHTPSIEQVLRQIELRGIQNLWIVNCDARVFMELLPSALCRAIYLHFPVPWPKKPHRRVWGKKFLSEALRILQKGGMLELRSDEEEYFLFALEIALDEQKAQCRISKNIQGEIISKYEDRWLRQNKDIFDLQVFALEESDLQRVRFDFSFPPLLDFPSLWRGIARSSDRITKKVIGSDWFLQIEGCYFNQEACVFKVSFGDFNQPQSKFVLCLKTGEVRYLGSQPLPTLTTYQAHKMLQEIIQEGVEFECSD